jgi:hypothetical protein
VVVRDSLTAAAGGMTDELARAEIEAKINSSGHPTPAPLENYFVAFFEFAGCVWCDLIG